MQELNKSDLAAAKVAQVEAITASQWTDFRDALLLDLYSEGLSFTRIGEMMHCSRNAVAGRLRRLGVGKGNGPLKGRERKKFIAEWVADGGEVRVAAERLRISHGLAERLWAEIARDCGPQASDADTVTTQDAKGGSQSLHCALWREHPKIMRNLGAVKPEDSRAI